MIELSIDTSTLTLNTHKHELATSINGLEWTECFKRSTVKSH